MDEVLSVMPQSVEEKPGQAATLVCDHRAARLIRRGFDPQNSKTRNRLTIPIHRHQDGIDRKELGGRLFQSGGCDLFG
jgi:hypothetical protein